MPDANGLLGKAAIGSYILAQRELSRLSLRELARMSQVSNANLSRVERGMHEPSLRVLAAVADALSLPFEDLTAQALPDVEPAKPGSSVDAVTASIEPSRGSLSHKKRHFLRCTPVIWQMVRNSHDVAADETLTRNKDRPGLSA